MVKSVPHDQFRGVSVVDRRCGPFLLTELFYEAETHVETHSHEVPNFCMAMTGFCAEKFERTSREFPAMTSNFLPAGLRHSLFVPASGMRAFSIEMDPQWHREFACAPDTPVYFTNGTLIGLMLRLYSEFQAIDSAAELSVEALTLEMIAQLSRSANPSGSTAPRWMDDVIDVLHDRFSEKIRLGELAVAAGVHPVHLVRAFHRYKGCTFGAYLRRLRIRKACTELSRPGTSIADIALAAGFCDQSHFTNAFRRETGITPSQFRKFTSSH